MDAKKKAIAFAAGAIAAIAMALFVLSGCASQGSGGGDGASADVQGDAQRASYDAASINELMGRLATAATLEEANAIMGFEGEMTDESSYRSPYDPPSTVSSTVDYEWQLGPFPIEGSFTTYEVGGEDEAVYETDYWKGKPDARADFSRWDEIEAALDSDAGLPYERMVELLGGTEGLREKVSTTGDVTYRWYDADGGYLWSMVGPDGMCGTTSGRF